MKVILCMECGKSTATEDDLICDECAKPYTELKIEAEEYLHED